MKIKYLILLVIILFGSSLKSQKPKFSGAFYYSSNIVIDSKGNAFVTGKNNLIVKITHEGKAELFAGDRSKHGKGRDFWLSDDGRIAIDAQDNLYVGDETTIRKITPNGLMTIVAGSNIRSSRVGSRSTATFVDIKNIAIDNKGTIYVTDVPPSKDGNYSGGSSGMFVIRKITSDGTVTTIK